LASPDISFSVSQDRSLRFERAALVARGSAPDQAEAGARVLVVTSLRGGNSHGIRLLPHYLHTIGGGRIEPAPSLSVEQTGPGAAVVDAGNVFGRFAGIRAIAESFAIATETGIAGVTVVNSSHFDTAGCYGLSSAEARFLGFAFANSDPFVLPDDGVAPFHGTNPLDFAAPVASQRPLLLDAATSTVPGNRITDYEFKGLPLPDEVVVDAAVKMTAFPTAIAALLSLDVTRFGFKGAGLAAMMEVLSAVLTGMAHRSWPLPMWGAALSTPRKMVQFFMVIDPDAFVPRAVDEMGIAAHLADLRVVPAKPGNRVIAPGGREWACQVVRSDDRISIALACFPNSSPLRTTWFSTGICFNRPDSARRPWEDGTMKFLRYGPRSAERPAILDAEGCLRDLSGLCGENRGTGNEG
jgi:ureidoglycolate dehydrogenase (NAD+)